MSLEAIATDINDKAELLNLIDNDISRKYEVVGEVSPEREQHIQKLNDILNNGLTAVKPQNDAQKELLDNLDLDGSLNQDLEMAQDLANQHNRLQDALKERGLPFEKERLNAEQALDKYKNQIEANGLYETSEALYDEVKRHKSPSQVQSNNLELDLAERIASAHNKFNEQMVSNGTIRSYQKLNSDNALIAYESIIETSGPERVAQILENNQEMASKGKMVKQLKNITFIDTFSESDLEIAKDLANQHNRLQDALKDKGLPFESQKLNAEQALNKYKENIEKDGLYEFSEKLYDKVEDVKKKENVAYKPIKLKL